jgi:hypothetical protein
MIEVDIGLRFRAERDKEFNLLITLFQRIKRLSW